MVVGLSGSGGWLSLGISGGSGGHPEGSHSRLAVDGRSAGAVG